MTVTVSICVPTYNGARYLGPCLDSALAQTFADFELVVVDDGSADATPEIVRRYAERDGRIRVWRNERNLGLVANWNRCVELARGEWLKFLFQDDLLEPSCLDEMLRAARSGVDLVVVRRGLIFEDGTPAVIHERYRRYLEEHDLARHGRGRPYLSVDGFAEILARNPTFNCIGEPTATLIRRSAFERYGRFNRDLVVLGDWEYAARVAANTGLCYVDATLAHFRVHPGAATAKIRGAREYRTVVIDPLVVLHEICYSNPPAPRTAGSAEAFPSKASTASAYATRGSPIHHPRLARHGLSNRQSALWVPETLTPPIPEPTGPSGSWFTLVLSVTLIRQGAALHVHPGDIIPV